MVWQSGQLGLGCGVEPYGGSETVSIASTDHTFVGLARALVVTATGNVKVELADGTQQVIPVAVAASSNVILDGNGKGLYVKKVIKDGTTATVLCGLY